jgi:general transcription factor 3C polypeptide 3 (transcription factor C subunit 4)
LEEQEALYNVGRAFHLLGLFPIAIEYYNKVLENFPDLDIEEDLKRQAAYNLVLIYNNSGNTKLSNSIMENYLVI